MLDFENLQSHVKEGVKFYKMESDRAYNEYLGTFRVVYSNFGAIFKKFKMADLRRRGG